MAGTGGGWAGGGDDTWGDWQDPARSEGSGVPAADPTAWSDTARDADGWYVDGPGDRWHQPTEAAPPARRRPVVLAAVLGVLVVTAAGLVGWRLAAGGDGAEVVEAVGVSSSAPESTTRSTTTTPTASPTRAPRPARSAPAASSCTREDVGRDSGWGRLAFLDCFGDWAMARAATGSGDGGIFRLVNGTWTPTRYGPSSCVPPGEGSEIPRALYDEYLRECPPARSSSSRRTSARTSTSARPPVDRPREEVPPPVAPAPEPEVVPDPPIEQEPVVPEEPPESEVSDDPGAAVGPAAEAAAEVAAPDEE